MSITLSCKASVFWLIGLQDRRPLCNCFREKNKNEFWHFFISSEHESSMPQDVISKKAHIKLSQWPLHQKRECSTHIPSSFAPLFYMSFHGSNKGPSKLHSVGHGCYEGNTTWPLSQENVKLYAKDIKGKMPHPATFNSYLHKDLTPLWEFHNIGFNVSGKYA